MRDGLQTSLLSEDDTKEHEGVVEVISRCYGSSAVTALEVVMSETLVSWGGGGRVGRGPLSTGLPDKAEGREGGVVRPDS